MSHEYSVELRIYGKDLNTSEITAELGLHPSLLIDKALSPKKDESLWAYTGTEEVVSYYESLDDGLQGLLGKVWPIKDKLEKYKLHFKVLLWCGHFQSSFDGGPYLSSATLKMLGELGIDLYIDSYHSEDKS